MGFGDGKADSQEVTLYGSNSGPLSCSSAMKIVAHRATCYDSSWVYYSIDGCLHPGASSVEVSSAKATATMTGLSAARVASSGSGVHTSVIIGSTVAGVSCIVLGLVGTLLILRRRCRRRPIHPTEPTHELSDDCSLVESDAAAEKKYPLELWGGHAAVEMGRNSRYEGMMREARPVRGVNPSIQIRFVP